MKKLLVIGGVLAGGVLLLTRKASAAATAPTAPRPDRQPAPPEPVARDGAASGALAADDKYAIAMTFVELGARAHEDEISGVLEALLNRHAIYLRRGLASTLRAIVLSELPGTARWGSVPSRYNPAIEQRVTSLQWDDAEVQRRVRILRAVQAGERRMPFKVINFLHPAGVPNSPNERRTLDPATGRYLPTWSVLEAQTQPGQPPGAARQRYDLTRDGRLTVFSA